MTPLQQVLSVLLAASAALNAITLLHVFAPSHLIHESPRASELPLSVGSTVFTFVFGKQYHYENDTEWATLIPPYHGHVKLGSPQLEFGVAMYSDLQCLDTVRHAIVQMRNGSTTSSRAAEDCFGQLRQAIDCTADITLEPAFIVCDSDGKCGAGASGDYVNHKCHNWAQVREFVEHNQATWSNPV
ncbi:hypothetical protein DFH07DRAFT_877083 [Mycena maculata]|uniref:Uncharacterized protein n=1 Tax=Mycena maculata TaxID=230809 RepID=A0AAD7K2C9_9AGAR|nr:hypothetical protein DFH07DRAFT_877083 [Mycena maculata]